MSKELYEQYISKGNDLEDNIILLNDIIREYPKLMDYINNKVDSCFGIHRVYVIHMRYRDYDLIKIGYTKNTIKKRFNEKRYSGRDNLEIVEVLREEELQAKGAIEFEKTLKNMFIDCKVNTDITLPGKGEMYDIEHKENILNTYDELIGVYRETVGLKSPN